LDFFDARAAAVADGGASDPTPPAVGADEPPEVLGGVGLGESAGVTELRVGGGVSMLEVSEVDDEGESLLLSDIDEVASV
jgi:hypothetical protein